MATNPLVAYRDRGTRQALALRENRIDVQRHLVHAAMNALTQTFVYSQYQVSQAVMATEAIEASLAAAGVPEDAYAAYFHLLQEEYFRQMATVTREAAEAISRQVG